MKSEHSFWDWIIQTIQQGLSPMPSNAVPVASYSGSQSSIVKGFAKNVTIWEPSDEQATLESAPAGSRSPATEAAGMPEQPQSVLLLWL